MKSLLVMADIAKDKRDSHQMSYYLHLADSLFQYGQLADDSLRAELSHQFGVLHLIKGEYEAAQQNFMQSYHLKTRLYGEKDTSLAVTYNNLGICAYRIGRVNEALAYYQKAIERARTMQSSPNILLARCIENAAIMYGEIGNYNDALKNFADALHIKLLASGENSQDVGRAYMNIANLEIDLSDYDNALMHLQKAEKIFLNLYGNDFGDFDAIYQNMGKIYNSRGDYEKALNYYNKAIEYLKRKNPEHPGIRDIYLNIGYIYFVRDDYEKALSYYRKSYSSTSPNLQTIKYYRNLARCYQSMGKADSAIYYYEKSIQLSKTDEANNYELATSYLY
ncbi:MAG TPA: tetratricopeptide repeat protein, partial [Bacteroidales bacterium]|nr:tetratricopeptide repeat protein [Bacteroidales bacterium]